MCNEVLDVDVVVVVLLRFTASMDRMAAMIDMRNPRNMKAVLASAM